MPIEFRCAQCGRLLRTGDDTAGKQAQCPECGALTTVPAAVAGGPGVPPRSPGAGSPFGGRPAGTGGTTPLQPGEAENPYQSPAPQAWRPQQPYAGPPIPNYLVQAILCTLFCCLPFGIVAIVFAAQVNTKQAVGDYYGAKSASDTARTWCWVSFAVGLIPAVLWFLFVVMTAMVH